MACDHIDLKQGTHNHDNHHINLDTYIHKKCRILIVTAISKVNNIMENMKTQIILQLRVGDNAIGSELTSALKIEVASGLGGYMTNTDWYSCTYQHMNMYVRYIYAKVISKTLQK